MRTLVYVIGPPGAGKSTLMAELTAGLDRVTVEKPFAHDWLKRGDGWTVGVELGRRRPDGFSGTDALSMSVQPKVTAWLRDQASHSVVVGEGARLANSGFLMRASEAGYTVHLFYLTAPGPVLDARCKARGSAQNESWRRGRATAALNLAERMTGLVTVTWLPGAVATPAELATVMRGRCHALEVLHA